MWKSICLANRDAILEFLQEYRNILGTMEQAIRESNEEDIEHFFATAKEYRDQLFSDDSK